MRKIFFIIGLILLSFARPAFSQNYAVKATTDSLEYLIGDFIHYTITVQTPENTEVFVPPFADSLKNLHFIKAEEPIEQKTEKGVNHVFRYVLAGYDSLEVTIPNLPVLVKNKAENKTDTLLTNKVRLFVNKVKVDKKKDIKDIKKVLTIPYDWQTLALIILGVILALAVAYFIYKKFFRKKEPEEKKKIKVVLPPHKIAYAKLSELEVEKLWQNGKVKEYHSKITEIIREYFENRFGFNSLEMTTGETLEELRKRDASLEVLQTVEKFLTNADMVKFAKFQPMPTVNEEMMKEAYKIIDLTKPREEETENTENV